MPSVQELESLNKLDANQAILKYKQFLSESSGKTIFGCDAIKPRNLPFTTLQLATSATGNSQLLRLGFLIIKRKKSLITNFNAGKLTDQDFKVTEISILKLGEIYKTQK